MFIYVVLVCLHRVPFQLSLLFLYRQRLTHFLPLRVAYCLENGFSQGPRTCGTRLVFYSAHKHENKHILSPTPEEPSMRSLLYIPNGKTTLFRVCKGKFNIRYSFVSIITMKTLVQKHVLLFSRRMYYLSNVEFWCNVKFGYSGTQCQKKAWYDHSNDLEGQAILINLTLGLFTRLSVARAVNNANSS